MNDDLARSVEPRKQSAGELESEIERIRTEIQAADNRDQLRLLANELKNALWKMDDLERELHRDDRRVLAPLFFEL